LDDAIRKAELRLKELDAALREAELRSKRSLLAGVINPVTAAILAGLLAFLGNLWITYLNNRSSLALEETKFKATSKVKQSEHEATLIVEAMKTGSDVSRARANFGFLLAAKLVTDPNGDIQRALDRGELLVLPTIGSPSAPIARTVESFDVRAETVRTVEAPIGNLITDAMRRAVDAEIGLISGGQIRSNAQFGRGAILTRRDFLAIMPFSNQVVPLQVSGSEVRLALERGVSSVGSGPFLQVSGLRIFYDPARAPGDRVREIVVGDHPLDVTRTYRVAVTDYMAAGGDGYAMFRRGDAAPGAKDGPVLADAVLEYIRQTASISSQPERRIVPLR
jgi:2',3'-cyclic-nucleotide 2'-phosphodiesterase (5'-nucleotidase family)